MIHATFCRIDIRHDFYTNAIVIVKTICNVHKVNAQTSNQRHGVHLSYIFCVIFMLL